MEERKLNPLLTPQELSKAETIFLTQSQCRSFPDEVDCLQKGKDISRKSTILQRCPFLDPEGLLRVGGRLRRSEISPNQKHPVILHRKDQLTLLIARQAHVNNMHVGPTGLMGILSIRYHVVGAKALVKGISCDLPAELRSDNQPVDGSATSLPCEASPSLLSYGSRFCRPFYTQEGIHT